MILINEYFDGNVKSLGYKSHKGNSSVGVMEAGEYEFGTSTHETMIVIEGEMEVMLPETNQWKTFKAGEKYYIEANNKFKVKVAKQTSYLCQYK